MTDLELQAMPTPGVVADAVAAVIAAQLAHHLDRLTAEDARRAADAAVRALQADGWYITALPPGWTLPAPATPPRRPR